jgi:hypothetical protein
VGSNGEGRDLVSPLTPSTRVQGTRKRLSSDCESSLPDHLHSRAPGLRQNTPRDAASQEANSGAPGVKGHFRHPRRGNRTSRSSAGRTRANEIGLMFRTVDPYLLEDPTLSGATSLSLAQVAQCLRRMLELAATGGAQDGDSSTPWHAEWFSSAELGFPLVADNFHRKVHPLIRQYVIPRIHAGDKTLESLLKFRGGVGNDHCEVCDHGTGSGPLILATNVSAHTTNIALASQLPVGGVTLSALNAATLLRRSSTFAYRNSGPSLRFWRGTLSPYGCWTHKCFLNTRPPLLL